MGVLARICSGPSATLLQVVNTHVQVGVSENRGP